MADIFGGCRFDNHPSGERIKRLVGLFSRKPNPITCRAQEICSEIKQIEEQISQLQDASKSSNVGYIRKTIKKTSRVPDDPVPRADEKFKSGTGATLEPDYPGLYNDQGMRKFDLHGWWQRTKRDEPLPKPTQNEKLVTYLATGRSHGYTALRKETRVARNRFILLVLVLVAVLWSTLSLLIPQL